MSPVDRDGPLTGTNFTLGSYEGFQPGFQYEKRPKTSCGAKFVKSVHFLTRLPRSRKPGSCEEALSL